jgi:hypothetical protein
MLRAEQAALQRSLEKERARASETRQELLALKEEAATHEGRASQLEDEMKELRTKHRKESQEAARKRESIEQVRCVRYFLVVSKFSEVLWRPCWGALLREGCSYW